MSIIQLIKKRCLLQLGSVNSYTRKDINEYRVLEVSPSGNWVKLQNIHGTKFWRPVAECLLIEELVEIKSEPPPTEN